MDLDLKTRLALSFTRRDFGLWDSACFPAPGFDDASRSGKRCGETLPQLEPIKKYNSWQEFEPEFQVVVVGHPSIAANTIAEQRSSFLFEDASLSNHPIRVSPNWRVGIIELSWGACYLCCVALRWGHRPSSKYSSSFEVSGTHEHSHILRHSTRCGTYIHRTPPPTQRRCYLLIQS